MSEKKPVIVYGVSGYTGRLVCEYLREFNIPFIAAGRDAARIQEVLDKIPGLDTVDHEVVEVEHTVEALTELFTGAQVVSNMVGPFIKLGGTVVEAALNAGCHYMDTTGEQDWVLDVQEKFGDKYQEKGLLLSPGIAQMYTTGEIAANIALETPGLDTLDILVLWKGFPTYASTQTIFTILKANWYYLEQNKYCACIAVGRNLPPGVVQERSASFQRQGCGWGVRPHRDGRCCRDTEDRGGADQDPARRRAGSRLGRDRRFGSGGYAPS
jgi:saccharopine dehydrogenase-like NADP-dependent oxidoreductase